MRTSLVMGALLALGCASEDASSFEYDEGAAALYAESYCSCNPTSRSREVCETMITGQLLSNSVFSARAGRLEVHGERWEECLAQVSECERETWPACEQLLIGQVEEGETCAFIDECTEGLYCADPEDALECGLGVCAETLDRGEPCDFDDACSGDDLCFALEGEEESTCRGPIARGEPCPIGDLGVEDYCAEGLHCVPDEEGLPVCDDPLELGEPCGFTLPDEVVEVTVNDGIYPNPCARNAICPETELECRLIDSSDFNSSEPRQQPGEECDGEFGELACDFGLACAAEVCVERKSVGESCGSNEECWGVCVDGECAPEFERCSGE